MTRRIDDKTRSQGSSAPKRASAIALLVAGAIAAGCGGSDRVIIVTQAGSPDTAVNNDNPDAPVQQVAASDPGEDPGSWGIVGEPTPKVDFEQVINKTAGMISDGNLRNRVTRRGLDVLNVMWEDTGRSEGSALGPNISDLTLQVRHKRPDGSFHSALMPVIRFPNFTDRTGDIPNDKFFVRVGNEKGKSLRSVKLKDMLRDLDSFLSVPSSIKGTGNFLSPRDTHFLVSAQAVFLPIPQSGKAEFNPVLFNYQSAPESPAVLSILATRQGTSVTVIENRGEDMSPAGRGQELYFNNNGQRAAFTAERRSDVEERIEAQGGPITEDDKTALQKGADVLFLIQVPLVHANRGTLGGSFGEGGIGLGSGGMPPPPAAAPAKKSAAMDMAAEEASDVEQAVLGHGPNLGPFSEGRNLRLVRDPKFPIRITVQFYKATSNGVVSDKDLDGIAANIGSVYEHADAVGSLVMPNDDPKRPTAWQSVPGEWFPW